MHFFMAEYKVLKLHPNHNPFFYSEIQTFENCAPTVIHSFTTEYEYCRVARKWSFLLPTKKCEI